MASFRAVATLTLFVLCLSCTKSKPKKVSFDSLTEDEKRQPTNALVSMHATDGLEVALFAAEPLVVNPTNISVDAHGRVWVCEAYNYDVHPDKADSGADRIVVLEDTDHDGVADKRTVFYQGTDINTPLGIFVAGESVYVSRSPNVLVLSDTNGDLVADVKDTLFTNLGRKGDHSAHSIFPGPDGLLYFSTGNMAGEIRDKNGERITDRAGFVISQKGEPYLGGMIMRFDPSGNNIEVLGHNFRNNYEPCIDSFGNLWQSDNDDDGNASCRINFILPYGNYGYLDEMTRASWTASRVNMEETVEERHWHQGDPGVVPNVLITGAGSPAGMVYYEGDKLLPDLNGVPVHAEPYYNVVRAYLPKQYGAGYTATIKDILKSDDPWFRPVDVSVAPDGSLFVADWYDPILGGGAAGDAGQGRIYRVAVNAKSYTPPSDAWTKTDDFVAAMGSPNPETRYFALRRILTSWPQSESALEKVWKSNDALLRARALWILGRFRRDVLTTALADRDPRIRMVAVKLVQYTVPDPVAVLSPLARDNDVHVRRELLTALRYVNTDSAAELWTALAQQYDGRDRWYLEALGIAADLHASQFFNAWRENTAFEPSNRAHRDIIWRMRAPEAMRLLPDVIRAASAEELPRLFRAFDFHKHADKNKILISLLDYEGNNSTKIAELTLRQMDASSLIMTPAVKRALENALSSTKGTLAFVDLVDKFDLKSRYADLLEIARNAPGTSEANAAVNLLVNSGGKNMLQAELKGKDEDAVLAILRGLEGKGNASVLEMVASCVTGAASTEVRQAATRVLASSWPGEEKLLQLVKSPGFPDELKPLAASLLFNVYRSAIRREAEKLLPLPAAKGRNLPPIKELVATSGNPERGQNIFVQYCQTCHQIGSEGSRFGPDLTQIGSKMSRDGLFRSIIFPNEGVSNGYESTLLTLTDGSQIMGIVASETDNEITLNQPGGVVGKYATSGIKARESSAQSMMPELAPAMDKQDLIDLVAYLATLKQ